MSSDILDFDPRSLQYKPNIIVCETKQKKTLICEKMKALISEKMQKYIFKF